MAAQIAFGLSHLHKDDYMHRDLKLENVLIRDDGNVVLADYSLSKKFKKD